MPSPRTIQPSRPSSRAEPRRAEPGADPDDSASSRGPRNQARRPDPAPERAGVLVLGGGPDAEREVSLTSARFVAEALEAAGLRVHRQSIGTLTLPELRALPGDVIFPVLHGAWGEGGQLQDLLEQDGRPFVGSAASASRAAMDKVATKAVAVRLGIATPPVHVLDLRDPACPLRFPVILKPVHEGSTVGLYRCHDRAAWDRAGAAIRRDRHLDPGGPAGMRAYMIEPAVAGRELTLGLIDDRPLPIIEIIPADGLYDYQAKYHRADTRYVLDPALPPAAAERIRDDSVRLARELGIRHLARADFMLDAAGTPWFLEINTIPGFTDHSLVPMAARHAGTGMPALCAALVAMARRDHRRAPSAG
ncbi:MAG TPA: D-alanine--D-alanine ligase [Phycisphaerales bacterium]|nr:D-alanine--D-alanine ligase [Phycisphaerales bacterium]